jgi:hypothetical protein
MKTAPSRSGPVGMAAGGHGKAVVGEHSCR